MNNQSYFYKFLKPISKELAYVARELENSIFTSPRMMLTHARVFVENILQQVMRVEGLQEDKRITLIERIDILDDSGYLTPEIRDALHHIRKIGNQAAHDTRVFRYSEALLSWEAVYKIVKWYVEVYGPVDFEVPEYQDPSPKSTQSYEISEIESRLKMLENVLVSSEEKDDSREADEETAAATEVIYDQVEPPGYTTIRTLTFSDDQVDVPYFLRDVFLLPQRFDKSERFLIRLGAEQQARIMSELPNNIEGLSSHVKRYNEKNEEQFFNELKGFIEEEKVRRQLLLERPGELFIFYKTDYIVITDELSQVPLKAENFTGIPNLLRQLKDDQIETVGQLPKEIVILAKYEHVGVGTVEKLFEQVKEKQR
ncbi:DUF4145 domain-containing protein [Virgibacillus sp. MSP4-1]|uniref:DUF4145 domain-containing protein n=1 Tax=Virgibacillus sp. MSP4-1 TaxID=2700081 RepID=UPI00039CC245|nr:DUF4145 domain-containing protein [Virgibacillus sp. MSP4-1]QHS21463.1 DUF4145 domain-containing protein [Virgibacillus sp. MSP4-1]